MRAIVCGMLSVILIFSICFASPGPLYNADNLFAKNGEDGQKMVEVFDGAMSPALNTLLLLLLKIGWAVAVCVSIILAIKLILTSPQNKADVKNSLMPYFIGLLLLIAGVPIAIKVMEIYIKIL